jgi:GNAT superfamily N-acetyltransferase
MIREICDADYDGLMRLYTHLHEKTVLRKTPEVAAVWAGILRNPAYHIIAAEEDGQIVSSCTCLIVPNLTHGCRPYALIENVVTHAAYRGRGLAAACLDYACEIARSENCYKMMLITQSKEASTLRFYERAGYTRGRTAFVKLL